MNCIRCASSMVTWCALQMWIPVEAAPPDTRTDGTTSNPARDGEPAVLAGRHPDPLTTGVGLATAESDMSPDDLLAHAGQALYATEHAGWGLASA